MFTFNRHAASIYFVRSDTSGLVKIGYSKNINARVNAIRKQGLKPVLFAVAPGGIRREREIHLTLSQFNTEGEWFAPSPLVMEYIAANSFPVGEGLPIPLYLEESSASYVDLSCLVHAEIAKTVRKLAVDDGVTPSVKTNEILCRALGREDLLGCAHSKTLWSRS